jgi:hypothetical protein
VNWPTHNCAAPPRRPKRGYEDWTFQDLSEALVAVGIAARKSDGVMVVRTADTNRALAERDEEEEEDEQ